MGKKLFSFVLYFIENEDSDMETDALSESEEDIGQEKKVCLVR